MKAFSLVENYFLKLIFNFQPLQYFYDNKKACFLYWDGRTRKYVEVPQTPESGLAAGDENNHKDQAHPDAYPTDEKNTKAKQAKKIALVS